VLGTEHPDTLQSVNNLAALYQTQGRYAEAEPLFRRTLSVLERVFGAEHPNTLQSANNLAGLCVSQGRYGEAEALYRRTLAASERGLGAGHPQTLTSVSNLAGLYQVQGRYAEAESLHRRALTASERVLGTEHPDTLTCINNLAALYQAQGRYGAAEPLFRSAFTVSQRILGAEHPDTLTSANNLAAVYESQGRYGEAEPLYQHALAARERALGAEHPQTISSVNNLALLYQAQGRHTEAEPLYRRALAAYEHALSTEHPDTLTGINNLAGLHLAQGRYSEAEPLYRRTLTARERILGAEHPDTLTSIANLAGLYDSQGRYGDAEPLYRRALAARERVLGETHPDTIGVHLNLAVLLISQQRLDAGLRALHTLDERMRRLVSEELASTEQEAVRLLRLAAESRLQDVVFTLALAHPDNAESQRLATNVLLRWKRLAADEEAVVARLARTSQDPRVVELAEQIRASRRELSRLVHLPRTDRSEDAREFLNAELAAERERLGALEVKLATLSRTFRGQQAARGVEWEAVQAALPPESALLELRTYRPIDFKRGEFGAPRWLALLLPETPPAQWIEDGATPPLRLWDLGPVADSTGQFAQLRANVTDTAAAALYQTLFGPIDAELARFQTLYLAPDGFLDLVAFARLRVPAPKGGPDSTGTRYWIERQALRVVRVGRDLLQTASREATAGMLVLGGIDYERFAGPEPATMPSGDDTSPYPTPDPKTLMLTMNTRLRAERGGFSQLKHTGLEAQEVSNYYGEDGQGGKAVVVEGVQATEARLKQLGQAPRVLHLATHGFFLPNPQSAQGPERGIDRALSLSGLAFAGANLGLQGQIGPDGEDGILYALEALDLNLEGTELVTLSACDTGQGRVDVSEGVYGLVRAFQIAGARNVLMTQWTLNDPAARAFMVAFYRRWLRPGAFDHPAEALRATQIEWIGSKDPVKADPRFWAPYVLIERG
jgi:CHAT domain-containing protein/tetratricopeptide (TPR) repeat protein